MKLTPAGYSVFAVRPLTGEEAERQEGLNGIPTTHADELAAAIPDDGPFDPPDTFTHSGASGTEVDYTLEDEDIELQKALQASLAHSSNPSTIASFGFPDTPYASSSFDRVGSGSASSYPPAPVRQSSSSAESARREFNAVREIDADQELRASTARAKERLEQAKKEQQMALRAASRSNSNGASINQRNSVDAVGGSGRHPGDEAEDQEFRRAIAESLREAGHQPNEVEEVEMDDDDDVRLLLSSYQSIQHLISHLIGSMFLTMTTRNTFRLLGPHNYDHTTTYFRHLSSHLRQILKLPQSPDLLLCIAW
jgi:hypothetical protein